MKLIPELREFLGLLISENVQYLVIGGWAYNYYAEPRFTGDLDIFVADTPENELRLRAVLEKFGFADVLPPLSVKLFRKKIIMLGRPPNRIDLLTEIDGVSFQEAWINSVEGNIEQIPIKFISMADLIKNKSSTGRDKDALDVKNLKKIEAFKP